MNRLISLILVGVALAACDKPEAPRKAFVDVAGLDNTIKPGDDFFRYVNGKWYDTATIDPDQSGVGSYMFLNIPQKKLLQRILDSISSGSNAPGSIEQIVGDFYASGMDTVQIAKRGYEPLQPALKRIDAITDATGVLTFASSESTVGNASIFAFYVFPDNENSGMNIGHVYQTGIGMPDRDYYFKSDAATVAVQEAYQKYIAKLFELTGSDAATASKYATLVYGIEKQLATSHKTNVEMRDINANYNKMKIAQLEKMHPNLRWPQLLENLSAKTETIDVAQPKYFEKLNALIKSIPVNDWKIYLKAFTLKNYADVLSKPFVDASFEFSKVLTGQAKQKTRKQVMTAGVDNWLGQALGQIYVKKHFNEAAKNRVLDLVNNLQKAFEVRINNLDWMSDSTKIQAKEKLHAITKKIGYPDKWRSYDKVQIDRSKYFENIISLNKNEWAFQLQKLDKPVDKSEWIVPPSTVTAYYNPYFNEIVFPAGILQFPYFDFEADDAINYGGIGMVIGHELTHAFDDQGAQFDKEGNVKNWWTKEDLEKFQAKTKRVVDLYSGFTVLDSVHINGALTLGENTADNGGVAIAYDAFKLTAQGKDTVKIDGFTPDQRFFLSIARIWRVKTRDAFLRTYVTNDPHSPAMWRVNGPLMSLDPFYKSFNVQAGDKHYLPDDERIKIW
ncbi:M13 family metallopeptidase [Pseudochryseolinea flava]|uniref:M13 family peptidase n=1 Tax=Pseudochryseolinea flava TaxID=2059302 RepID=A0A364XVH3_9BACT|nr:M13 family metallopeptidase [Pseudochryseolinea flava]RAV97708.1 M13 family peptidase [Pseudochryseolinea flava]